MTNALARMRVSWSLDRIATARAAMAGDALWLDSARGDAELGERSLVALELAPVLRASLDGWHLHGADGAVLETGTTGGAAHDAGRPWRALDAALAAWRDGAPDDPLGFVMAASWEAAALCDPAIAVHPAANSAVRRREDIVLRVDRVLCGVVEHDGERILVARGRDAGDAQRRAQRWVDTLRDALDAGSSPANEASGRDAAPEATPTSAAAASEASPWDLGAADTGAADRNPGDRNPGDRNPGDRNPEDRNPEDRDAADRHLLAVVDDRAQADHERRVEAVVEAIHAGRVFQACLTYPLVVRRPGPLLPLYLRLRAAGPTDLGGWLRWGDLEAAMASPERFLSFRDRVVRARPMKGTRPRSRHDHGPRMDGATTGDLDLEDVATRDELAANPKDRAENVMIVDLLRNDLGRVCAVGSVHVPELFTIETYGTVHQMTSTVEGALRDGVGVFEAFAACFPPGSMSGAPKVEACALIAELETEPRGLYAGSVGWIGCDGRAEFNVVIRSLVASGPTARWSVGGGVVADSTGTGEWLESRAKLAALEAVATLAQCDAP